jgi:hypothetical protein
MTYLLETLHKLSDANLVHYGSAALISIGEISVVISLPLFLFLSLSLSVWLFLLSRAIAHKLFRFIVLSVFILSLALRKSLKSIVLSAYVKLRQAVGSYILPFLDQILKKIKSIIAKQKDKLYAAAISCVRMLASSIGPSLADYMPETIGRIPISFTFLEYDRICGYSNHWRRRAALPDRPLHPLDGRPQRHRAERSQLPAPHTVRLSIFSTRFILLVVVYITVN